MFYELSREEREALILLVSAAFSLPSSHFPSCLPLQGKETISNHFYSAAHLDFTASVL